jgi:hypothetical protein
MSINDELPDAISNRDRLKAQLGQLEAYVERATAAGELVPPEAADLVQRLREVVLALDSLTASFETR